MSSTIRTLVIALLAVALLAPAGSVAQGKKHRPAATTANSCPDADLAPAADNLRRIRAAILCLHNRIRVAHRRRPVHVNGRLRRAAVGHSRHMVANRYFEHTTPAGITMVDRLLSAHYVRSDQGWVLGENLAWGTGSLATPRGVLRAWMDSPGHRANVLRRAYHDLGVGVVLGVPVSDAPGATYTVDFGVRR